MSNLETIFLFIAIIQCIGQGVLLFQGHEMIGEIRALRRLLKKDMQEHQDWLFNQLYNMAPGKVLKPNEAEPESEDVPAVVIHTNRDPYNEFKGKRDDWR